MNKNNTNYVSTFSISRLILLQKSLVRLLNFFLKRNYFIFKIFKRDSFRPIRGTLSINKAEKLLDYKPKYNIEKNIKEYIKFKKKYN